MRQRHTLAFAFFLGACLGCGAVTYEAALQRCIVAARTDVDATTYELRLAEYTACADALDAGLGPFAQTVTLDAGGRQ